MAQILVTGFLILVLVSVISISAASNREISRDTYIVRIRNDMKPSFYSNVEHWYVATLKTLNSDPLTSPENDHEFLHVYKTVFHGFSTSLTQQQADQLKNRPGVLSVLSDKLCKIQTTRTPEFLGLSASDPAGILKESDSGSNVIIGVIDTGIFPEHPSFHEEGLGPIPSHWKGECVEGENFTKNHCNKKIIGARYFLAGYKAKHGIIDEKVSVKSARDTHGHGTHTASTAAGRLVRNASLFGFASGTAVGVAPKARIAVYKVCWGRGCMESDILAAFDKAADDGVDVISISMGGGGPNYLNPIAVGAFGAMDRGIFVSASAGNDGPVKGMVLNAAPWITTVGASTIDRSFPADAILGDGRIITGSSLFSGKNLPKNTKFPLIYGGNAAAVPYLHAGALCTPGSLDEDLVRGKIVICERGTSPRVTKGRAVKEAGGVGVIIANVAPIGEGLIADPHIIPAVAVTESQGRDLIHYSTSTKNPRATMAFRGTKLGVKPSPVVASFSSRGPNMESLSVLKPDIIAPGVNILAAWPNDVPPTEFSSDIRRTEFNILSGTSMSCPHVSGLAALLKGAHPDWTPAMVRSALMTTAYTQDHDGKPLLDEKLYNIATIWDMGAGHVDPRRAVDPGLVYDLTVDDYLSFLCASGYNSENITVISHRMVDCKARQVNPWDINYPAIAVGFDADKDFKTSSKIEIVAARTVLYAGDGATTFRASIVSPKGVNVTVEPQKMTFRKSGEKRRFVLRISAEKVEVLPGNTGTEVGKLTWTDAKHQVTSPILVSWLKVLFHDESIVGMNM